MNEVTFDIKDIIGWAWLILTIVVGFLYRMIVEVRKNYESLRAHHDMECEVVRTNFNKHVSENERELGSIKTILSEKNNELEKTMTRHDEQLKNVANVLEKLATKVESLIDELRKK